MGEINGVVGKQWAPNCYHLCANIHRITRPLVIQRAPFAGPPRRALGRDTAIYFPELNGAWFAVMVPPARFWPNLTLTWKFNNYCPILRPSYSNSHSLTFPLCYFPFCPRDPSVFRNAFIDFFFPALLFLPRYCSESLKHSNESCVAKCLTSNWNGPQV